MRYLIFTALLIFPSVSQADSWTSKDTKYQVVYIILHGVDYLQTKEIARNPKYYELNPILGKHPDQNDVDLYFVGTAIIHTSIAYMLPSKYRRIWQCVFIGLQIGCVAHNFNAGIRIQF